MFAGGATIPEEECGLAADEEARAAVVTAATIDVTVVAADTTCVPALDTFIVDLRSLRVSKDTMFLLQTCLLCTARIQHVYLRTVCRVLHGCFSCTGMDFSHGSAACEVFDI